MNLNQRLQRLEAQFVSDPIVLWLTDGSIRQISYRGRALLNLFMAALSEENCTPEMEQHLNWIRDATAHHNPEGGQMMDLIRMVLNAPKGIAQSPPDRVRPVQLGPVPTRPGARN